MTSLTRQYPSTLVWLTMLAGIWMLSRPYNGIWHDGTFYAAQALSSLHPAVYGHDLFFAFGSQDQFTLFSPLFAAVISALDLDHAVMVVTVAGQILWLWAVWRLSVSLLGKEWAFWCLLMVVSWDSIYGAYHPVGFGEGSATARIYAEAFTILGLSFWLANRNFPAIGALSAAILLHPLIALAGLGVIGLMYFQKHFSLHPGYVGLIALIFIVAVVWVAQVNGKLPVLTADWEAFTRARSPFIYVDKWRWEDVSRLLMDVCLLWLAQKYLNPVPANLARLALWVMVLAYLLAFIGLQINSQLIVASQFWRAQWLGHVLAALFFVPLFFQFARGAVWDKWLAFGMVLALLLGFDQSGYALLGVVLVGELGKRYIINFEPRPVIKWLAGLLLLQAIIWFALSLKQGMFFSEAYGLGPGWLVPLVNPIWVLALSWLTVSAQPGWLRSGGLAAVGLVWLLVGAVHWNRTLPFDHYDDPARQEVIKPIRALIPESANVYWDGELDDVWFWLRRASYVHFHQGAGSIFFKGNYLEFQRRLKHLEESGFRHVPSDWLDKKSEMLGVPTQATLFSLCKDPLLDFMVLGVNVAGVKTVRFVDPGRGTAHFLYDCRDFRDARNMP